MTVRELILLLERHDPEAQVLYLGPDYGSGSYFEVGYVEESSGVKYLDQPEWCSEREWNVRSKKDEPNAVKVLLIY